jgi:hypothetical protein
MLLIATVVGGQIPDGFHLTARDWKGLDFPPERYLEVIEGQARFSSRLQNTQGAIIDPFLQIEHQYATPYFAYAVGMLIHAGRAKDLLPYGARAMEHATDCFGKGVDAIPEKHGEFFIAVLTGALPLYKGAVPPDQWLRWQERMKTPSAKVVRGSTNNWETYVMKGDWLRFRADLISRRDAVARIERAWNERQSRRIAAAPWFLYHDRTSDPDTLSVEAVGRGNLLALAETGYDGPSAAEIRRIAQIATRNTLWLQDPTGQVPANGRTDNHVWVEIGYQLAFDVMAESEWEAGNRERAGQYRRAAALAFQSAQRWRRSDDKWAGSFYITKNFFDPALRVGYQPASQYTNYNGSLMFHLSEALHARKSAIPERPTPSEIGGYAFELDQEFSSAFANAGGMFVQANLRGQEKKSHANYWTPLGIVRFARPGWESRLGPSDGAFDGERGISFAPAFEENGKWLRIADLPHRYRGKWSVDFVHPMLVRCSITYEPKDGGPGPIFRNDLVITPDGVLSEVTWVAGSDVRWGVVWPVMESDGRALHFDYGDRIASVSYGDNADQQTFIALNDDAKLMTKDPVVRSTFGDLRPVIMTTGDNVSRTFVYPRSQADPAAEDVRKSWKLTQNGFSSLLGRVEKSTYSGRTSAGGRGVQLGEIGLTFTRECEFAAHIQGGRVLAIEADREVTAVVGNRRIGLRRFTPAYLQGVRGKR